MASAADAVVVGIGNQGSAFFSDPTFLALHIHEARLTVSWDVATARSRHRELQRVTDWLDAAATAHVAPLVSFSGIGSYIPSVGKYTHAIKAFIHRFPEVKRYTAWNEPDWIYRSLSRRPLLAASFFNSLAHNCHHCTALAGDVYLPAKQLEPWLRAYKKGLDVRPSGWALHNYDDIRSHATSQLRVMLKLTSGPIWLDEISGVENRGHWKFPHHQSDNAAARDETFLFSLPHRFHRISRIYHYVWQATRGAGWDSGLLAPDGTIRPAYYVVARATG
jgi:hypothetical protein